MKTLKYFGMCAGSLTLLVSIGCSSPSTLSRRKPSSEKYPITVIGGDESSFSPAVAADEVEKVDPKNYDVIVIGAGLAGLSSAVYLTDQQKKILVLEKENEVGGLASNKISANGVRYDRGAAYWTDAYREEMAILKRIGLGDYKTRYPIPEPIDSYFLRGKMYEGIWDEKTLAELPASFALFSHELKKDYDDGLIPDQPMEESPKMDLDRLNAAEFIRAMPARLRMRGDAASRAVVARFDAELASGRLKASDPMEDVVGLQDLYCRSALGENADQVSAMAFANFYISELQTRYTSSIGTSIAAVKMNRILLSRPALSTIRTNAAVVKVLTHDQGADVIYTQGGHKFRAHSKYIVFSAQLKLAPKLIEGFASDAPEQTAMINKMGYSNYSVHGIILKGHPYRLSYDTWIRSTDYTDDDFTDLILGRWNDPKLKGYEGYRDFKKDPADDKGIITLYQPLPQKWVGSGYTVAQATEIAAKAVDRMLQVMSPVLKEKWGTRIDIESVETSRWPFSVHIAKPGHFITEARLLRKPFHGRVFFGNNNIGTPAFEEALFRGHCAANNVLKRMVPSFHNEKWSRCPIDAD